MRVLRSERLTSSGVRHAFSLRAGGVSLSPFDSLNLGFSVGDDPTHVTENLTRFASSIDARPDELRTVSQVHGDRVVFAHGRDALTDADGAVLSGPVEADAVVVSGGAVAGVRTADCVPVLLFDPRTGVAAAIHAGWRGTYAEIVRKTVEAMKRVHGVEASDLCAAIGPAIGKCCYEVGDDLAAKFTAHPSFGASVVDRTRSAPHLDLALANRRLLWAAGLPAEAIDDLAACTCCDEGNFFSHRRDAGRTGRHLAVIASRARG